MKKVLGLIFASALLVFGLAAESSAQTRKPWNINSRQQRQQTRIYNGISSGELNRREAARLERNQYQINRMESRFRRSGEGINPRERYRLYREQNQASRRIYRQKHDRQDRP